MYRYVYVGDLPKTRRENKCFVRIFRPDKNTMSVHYLYLQFYCWTYFFLSIPSARYVFSSVHRRYTCVLSFRLDEVSGWLYCSHTPSRPRRTGIWGCTLLPARCRIKDIDRENGKEPRRQGPRPEVIVQTNAHLTRKYL